MPGKAARTRRAALCGLAFAVICLAASASAAPPDPRDARPLPPSAAQAERWTQSFLSTSGGPDAAKSGGTGGTGGAGGGLLPRKRVVALYGIPGDGHSVIGRKSVRGAKRKLREEARRFDGRGGRDVVPAFDVVSVIATSCSSRRDLCRTRQDDAVIRRYLRAARELGGRLILDIQPGRSGFLDEIRALRRWVVRRDVDVALDPEWNVGPHGVPGVDAGSVRARELNRASRYLQRLVNRRGLPAKLMVVHQFTKASVRHRGDVRERADVDVTLDFDGSGTPAAKESGYESLSRPELFNGIMLFLRLDTDLMSARQVLRLSPEPDFVAYQ